MDPKPRFARIAITLPPETLRAADEIAARQDRSRSWVVAEAIRHYAAAQGAESGSGEARSGIGPLRREQLRRDLALSPEERVRESEELASIGVTLGAHSVPHAFPSYDAFLAWRREREGR